MNVVSLTERAGIRVRAFTRRATYAKILCRIILRATEIDWVDLLATILGYVAVAIEAIVLVCKLFARQNHRNSHRRQEARKRQLHSAFNIGDARAPEEIEEALLAEAFDVV